jgi:hypothetical protein
MAVKMKKPAALTTGFFQSSVRSSGEDDRKEQEVASNYNRASAASRLKLVGGPIAQRPKQLRAGGLEPDASMEPGDYVANCEGATITSKGKSTIAVLEFRIIDGPHSGTSLRQWITIPDIDGSVPLGSRYAKQCALALGREIESGDDLDPCAIFKSKTFRIEVGYRLTEKVGGQHDPKNAFFRKDAKDFLRVHKLLAVEELQ